MSRSMIDLPVAPDLPGALCAEVDPDLWFPDRGGRSLDAKRVCRRCPVAGPCLDYALEYPVHGIWGGTTVEERRVLVEVGGRRYNPVLTSVFSGPRDVPVERRAV